MAHVVTVILSGIPQYTWQQGEVELTQLAQYVQKVFEGQEIGTFRVREVKERIAIDFSDGFDAMTAQSLLDGKSYWVGGAPQVLRARVTHDPALMSPRPLPPAAPSSDDGEPSCALRYTNSKIDAQLNLLKIKKKVIKTKEHLLEKEKKKNKDRLKKLRKKSRRRALRGSGASPSLSRPGRSRSRSGRSRSRPRRSRSRSGRSRSRPRRSRSKSRRSRSKSRRSRSRSGRSRSKSRRSRSKSRRSRSRPGRSQSRSGRSRSRSGRSRSRPGRPRSRPGRSRSRSGRSRSRSRRSLYKSRKLRCRHCRSRSRPRRSRSRRRRSRSRGGRSTSSESYRSPPSDPRQHSHYQRTSVVEAEHFRRDPAEEARRAAIKAIFMELEAPFGSLVAAGRVPAAARDAALAAMLRAVHARVRPLRARSAARLARLYRARHSLREDAALLAALLAPPPPPERALESPGSMWWGPAGSGPTWHGTAGSGPTWHGTAGSGPTESGPTWRGPDDVPGEPDLAPAAEGEEGEEEAGEGEESEGEALVALHITLVGRHTRDEKSKVKTPSSAAQDDVIFVQPEMEVVELLDSDEEKDKTNAAIINEINSMNSGTIVIKYITNPVKSVTYTDNSGINTIKSELNTNNNETNTAVKSETTLIVKSESLTTITKQTRVKLQERSAVAKTTDTAEAKDAATLGTGHIKDAEPIVNNNEGSNASITPEKDDIGIEDNDEESVESIMNFLQNHL